MRFHLLVYHVLTPPAFYGAVVQCYRPCVPTLLPAPLPHHIHNILLSKARKLIPTISNGVESSAIPIILQLIILTDLIYITWKVKT